MTNSILFLAGAALVFTGVWQIYPPAAFIAAGLFIMLLAFVFSTSEAKARGAR